MISARYAVATTVLLALALGPTIIHSYVGVVVDDGRRTSVIGRSLGDFSASSPTKRSADWGERRFDSHDWFEREYSSPSETVVLTVIRSFDLKELYHHPELAVAYHFANFDTASVRQFEGRPEVPVHVLVNDGSGAVGMYVLEYDRRFIADPIRFQLRTAGELLFTGRKAMTLFFVRDDVVPAGADALKLPAARLLLDAVKTFEQASPT